MTVLIAHRGNLTGPNPKDENRPDYIMDAINQGYMVEIDLRMFNGKPMLGHDEPQYGFNVDLLHNYKPFLWVHCKDVSALDYCRTNTKNNYFWHETDAYTITSWNYFWAYPGQEPIKDCVMVMPELHWKLEEYVKFQPYGICSDYVEDIRNYK